MPSLASSSCRFWRYSCWYWSRARNWLITSCSAARLCASARAATSRALVVSSISRCSDWSAIDDYSKRSVAREQQGEPVQGLVNAGAVVNALLQKPLDMRVQAHRAVELHIVALGVSAHADQVAIALVARQCLLELIRLALLGVTGDGGHRPADRRFDIDGWVVPAFGQVPGQHNVPVQNRPRRVGNRVLLVVALAEHRVKRGDRATTGRPVAGALHQFGQLGE